MQNAHVRDYRALVNQLQGSLDRDQMGTLGEISTKGRIYPLLKVVLGNGNPKRALISAGIHGNESAGVEAIREYLGCKGYRQCIQEWEITLLPCLNPWGYEFDRRENYEQKDLNREFKSNTPPLEVTCIQPILQQPFHLALELHEDAKSSGYYLYLGGKTGNELELGEQILNTVKEVIPLNLDSKIDGEKANQGIIERGCGEVNGERWPMAVYTLAHGSQACYTLETSGLFLMKTRISSHLIAIQTALENFPT